LPWTIIYFAVNIQIILRVIEANSPFFLRTLFYLFYLESFQIKALSIKYFAKLRDTDGDFDNFV
jgi:hypothetical protein